MLNNTRHEVFCTTHNLLQPHNAPPHGLTLNNKSFGDTTIRAMKLWLWLCLRGLSYHHVLLTITSRCILMVLKQQHALYLKLRHALGSVVPATLHHADLGVTRSFMLSFHTLGIHEIELGGYGSFSTLDRFSELARRLSVCFCVCSAQYEGKRDYCGQLSTVTV